MGKEGKRTGGDRKGRGEEEKEEGMGTEGKGGERKKERGGEEKGGVRKGRGKERREGTPQIFTWIDAYGMYVGPSICHICVI